MRTNEKQLKPGLIKNANNFITIINITINE